MTAAGSYTNAYSKIKIKLVTHVYTLVVQQLPNLFRTPVDSATMPSIQGAHEHFQKDTQALVLVRKGPSLGQSGIQKASKANKDAQVPTHKNGKFNDISNWPN